MSEPTSNSLPADGPQHDHRQGHATEAEATVDRSVLTAIYMTPNWLAGCDRVAGLGSRIRYMLADVAALILALMAVWIRGATGDAAQTLLVITVWKFSPH